MDILIPQMINHEGNMYVCKSFVVKCTLQQVFYYISVWKLYNDQQNEVKVSMKLTNLSSRIFLMLFKYLKRE